MSNRKILCGAKVITQGSLGNLTPGYVIIKGNRIEAVGPQEELHIQPEDSILDCTDKSILPGLIDSHCHLICESNAIITDDLIARGTLKGVLAARATVRAGITTVRDLGCKHLGIFALKKAIESGQISGPRVQTAARNISGTGVPIAWRNYAFDGPDELRNAVRREWQVGATWIKLIISNGQGINGIWHDPPLLSLFEIKVVVDEAHRKGLRVSCHAEGDAGAGLAVSGGSDSVEHGIYLTDDVVDKMVEMQTFLIPTVWWYSIKTWRPDYANLNKLHRQSFQRALSAGVKIVAGTDADNRQWSPRETLVNELKTLVVWGMNEVQALEAATIRGAELLGLESQLGSLAPGKLADLIVIDGDPHQDIQALEQIVLVMQEGQIVFDNREQPPQFHPCPLSSLQPTGKNK